MYRFKEYNSGTKERDYDHAIRERANESLEELRNNLEGVPSGFDYVSTTDSKSLLTKTVHPRILTWQDGGLQPSWDSGATFQLRNMLQERNKSAPSGPLPTPEEAATLLQNQAAYTSHLEAESLH
uniref:Uncharacterized protein n=1 Tax=Arion vulgaris TaxID=1028688 RepID=A0A0B7A862_9EUPU